MQTYLLQITGQGQYGRAETVLSQEPGVALFSAIILLLILYVMYISLKHSYKFTKEKLKDFKFDFGLASKEEVYEKVGEDMGKIIIEERRIAFYRFGWLWAAIGSALTFIILMVFKALTG